MALLEILSVAEVLKYFGILFGMDANEFKSRLNFLTNFLDIKELHTPIIELRYIKFLPCHIVTLTKSIRLHGSFSGK